MLSCDIFLRFQWLIPDWPWMTLFPSLLSLIQQVALEHKLSGIWTCWVLSNSLYFVEDERLHSCRWKDNFLCGFSYSQRHVQNDNNRLFSYEFHRFCTDISLKKKALSDDLCTKKVHFLWRFILSAQETLSWKLESELSCFTCFASQRYEWIPMHNNNGFIITSV